MTLNIHRDKIKSLRLPTFDAQVVRRLATNFAITFAFIVPLFVLLRVFLQTQNLWTDWQIFYPALRASDPYSVYGYFNPPWLLWLLYPFSFVDRLNANVLWIAIVVLLTMRCVYELGGNWLSLLIVLVSPGFVWTMVFGQVDILVLFGLLLGSWSLILIKPQVIGMSILYQIIVARKIDWASIALIVASFAVSGLWFIRMTDNPSGYSWNLSLFPYGVPIGILLFGLSVIKKDVYLAALSTYFFAPYLSRSSMLVYSIILTSRYNKWIGLIYTIVLWADWILFPK